MIISNANIKMDDKDFSTVIKLISSEDRLLNCAISGGAIIARNGAWFRNCIIKQEWGSSVQVLGEVPPELVPLVVQCLITNTELPDAYFANCRFETEPTEAQADYICDGHLMDGPVTTQAAIDALPNRNGKVILLDGVNHC